jgi:hypothetical protein
MRIFGLLIDIVKCNLVFVIDNKRIRLFSVGLVALGNSDMKAIILVNVAYCLAWFIIVCDAWAGPFGIEQGQSKNSLELRKVAPHGGIYNLRSVPRRHPDFEVYAAEISERFGVCRVSAGSMMFRKDRFGTNVRSKFDEIVQELEDIYGKGKRFEHLRADPRWHEKRDWVMSITQNERMHRYEWSAAHGSRLKDGIKYIKLRVQGIGEDVSFIALEYDFENRAKCLAEKTQNLASTL